MTMRAVLPTGRPVAAPNPHWANLPLFDRSKWETVRFGDVVELVSDTSRNPEAEGITRFIGMEHLEPGSLHIKTWGELVDGVTFTKRCRKGQVLFGKRRAYQRKVAVAEFDALVSGDIYVFQAKEELLDPKLLPFLCMSERFFQFAVETSAGSLSPRTNWSHLAEFEFSLPPLEHQHRIADLLWAIDSCDQAQVQLMTHLEEQTKSVRDSFLGTLDSPSHDIAQVKDIGAPNRQAVQVGPFGGSLSSRFFKSEGVPVLKIHNITEDNDLDLSNLVFVDEAHAETLDRYRVEQGDLITAAQATTGRSALVDQRVEDALISQHLIRVAIDHTRCLPEYLLEVFSSPLIIAQIDTVKAKTTRDGLNTDDVASFSLPLPSIEVQQNFLSVVNRIRAARAASQANRAALKKLSFQLLSTSFDT